jgi:hypothetical protein
MTAAQPAENELIPPNGDLEELLAPTRWSTRRRDPGFRKAIGALQAQVAEARRLLRLPRDRTPRPSRAAIRELRSLLEIDPGTLTTSSAWELRDAIKRLNLRLGDVDFVWSQLQFEAARDHVESRHKWSDYFSTQELSELLAARANRDVSSSDYAEALDRLTFLYLKREEAHRDAHARVALQAQGAAGVSVALAIVLVVADGIAVGVHPEFWKTAVVALLIGLVASPALVAPWVARIRDQTTTLDLGDFQLRAPPVAMFGLGVSLSVAAGFAIAHAQAGQLEEKDSRTLSTVVFALVLTAFVVKLTDFWRRWIFWRRPYDERFWSAVFASVVALAALTELFAIVTVALGSYGALDTGRGKPPGLGDVEHYYAWNLADAMPTLEVTKTMNWARPLRFSDHGAGLLLLTYKLLVILPIAALVAHLIDRSRQKDDQRTR